MAAVVSPKTINGVTTQNGKDEVTQDKKDGVTQDKVTQDGGKGIEVQLVGTFGWCGGGGGGVEVHPVTFSTASARLEYFLTRARFPGVPPLLKEPLPKECIVTEEQKWVAALPFDRAPLEMILECANRNGVDWQTFDIVTPRRNLKTFLTRRDVTIDVQRFQTGPVFMARTVTEKQTNVAAVGFQFEKAITIQPAEPQHFRTVVKLSIPHNHSNPITVLLSAEADAVLAPPKNNNQNDNKEDSSKDVKSSSGSPLKEWLRLEHVRELKAYLKKRRNTRTLARQCQLSGTTNAIIGYKTLTHNDPNTYHLKIEETKIEPCSSEIANKLYDFLYWVTTTIPKDAKIYRIIPSKRKYYHLRQAPQVISPEMLKLLYKPTTTTTTTTNAATTSTVASSVQK